MDVRFVGAAALAAGCVALAEARARDAFSTYGESWREVRIPPVGPGSFDTRGDFLPDGRIVAVTGSMVFLERGARTGVFDAVGVLDASEIGAATDPAFLRVSPDGASIAIGAGFLKPVAVFAVDSLGTPGAPAHLTSGSVARYFHVGHYDAEWRDSTRLAITAGEFGSPAFVSLLDTTSSPAAPVNPVIVSNIGGASSGITFDSAGRLYTGNGFDFDPESGSRIGTIRAFEPESWTSGAVDFEIGGTFIGDVLSAASLAFDLEGNLIVGGGNLAGDAGYLGVINAEALAAALAGMGPIDPSDPLQLKRLDPLGTGMGYFGSVFDASTGELFATDGATWYGTIPAPGVVATVVVGAVFAARRRRHA